ncbi:MAG: cytochrome c1 [Paracoccus sp. (in: a-proteobacteria)]|nr:cytochrome c1 [Paracoccus sp. (in: a-proteobacteria)]
MTLRTKTLTAALALTIHAGLPALAQEATTVPMTAPDAAGDEATFVATPETSAADDTAAADVAESPDAVALTADGEAVIEVETTTDVPPVEDHARLEAGFDEVIDEEDEVDTYGGGSYEGHTVDVRVSFEGPVGTFDQFQLQRGLQVYTEVCSACHGMEFVPIRSLSDRNGPGLPEDQVRAYAAELLPIYDPVLDEERPRVPTDHFPTVSGDGMGPDLSVMAKARAGFHGPYGTGINQLIRGIGGPEYLYSLLVGYTGQEQEQAGTLFYGNTAFPGGWISMAPPLSDDRVTYEDGTPATVEQMAMDVAAFLMWTAEPKMMDRKKVGLVSVLFLILLTVLLYLTNKRIWAPHKNKLKQND